MTETVRSRLRSETSRTANGETLQKPDEVSLKVGYEASLKCGERVAQKYEFAPKDSEPSEEHGRDENA